MKKRIIAIIFVTAASHVVLTAVAATVRDPFFFPKRKESRAQSEPSVAGIAICNDRKTALLTVENSTEIVSVGEVFEGHNVEKIDHNYVLLSKNGERRRLVMK